VAPAARRSVIGNRACPHDAKAGLGDAIPRRGFRRKKVNDRARIANPIPVCSHGKS
jgi:hypothetical protein